MSQLYGDAHRALQDEFGTRALADRIEMITCQTEFDPQSQAFIEPLEMFFLATVDCEGRPSVSYKGGAPGFVQVIGPRELIFPSYDGNGMFLSLGNLAHHPQVGLLFISFQRPHRLRLQGNASLSRDPDLLAHYPEADLVVRVQLTALWPNCPRYIPRTEAFEPSRYVPTPGQAPPVAGWKQVDLLQDVLPARDRDKVEAAGTISIEGWYNKLNAGDPTA
jgi:uncharacterized protein